MQTIGRDHHPIDVLVYQYLNYNERAVGSSLKQEELAAAKMRAYCDGLAVGITESLNASRVEHYRQIFGEDLKAIPALDNWRVSKEMWDRRRLFKELSEQGPSKELFDKKREFQQQVIDWLFSLVPDEGLELHAEQSRRQRVLAGEVEPLPEDATWLKEELNKTITVAQPYHLALEKLGNPRVQ